MAGTNGNGKAKSEILDRQPPFDLDAESGVIGSAILNCGTLDDVSLVLEPGDFYDDAHKTLYQVVLGLHEKSGRVDLTLLTAALKKSGDWEKIGGSAFVARVAQSVPNAAHATYYARIVKEHAILRDLINFSAETLRDCYEAQCDPEAILEAHERRMSRLSDRTVKFDPITSQELLMRSLSEIDSRMTGHTGSGVTTGFSDLDTMIGGMGPGSLNILAGRPAMGKTAMALGIAEYAALEKKHPTLLVSLEMSGLEVGDRLLSSSAQVSLHRMRNGTLSQEDRGRLVETASELSMAPLYTVDQATLTVRQIGALARQLARKNSLKFIVIDYLQLIEPENSREPRQEQVAGISRKLKGLARELSVPVLCLAQLNRQAENTSDHRPRLSHLRESGGIENDADLVLFVHREEYYLAGEAKEKVAGQAQVIIAKQRNGPVGEVDLVWRKEYAKFVEKAPERLGVFDDYNRGNEGF